MLSNLLYILLFETVQPSYGTFLDVMPAPLVAKAFETPTLGTKNAPIRKTQSREPVLDAKSIYAVDLASGEPLMARDIFSRRSIASIEKLVTAMVVLDHHKLDEHVIVSKNAATQEGSGMGLKKGEEITVENLLTGMLINSGNDSATALAEFTAGSEAAFSLMLNEKADELGLQNTHFSNAKGFDEENNSSTAFDTMRFSRAALDYPFIRKTVAQKTADVTSANGKIKHHLESTNELLENPYYDIVGLKTGHTPDAGQSFVALLKAPKGREILTVMLDSPNRFKETKILVDWILRTFEF